MDKLELAERCCFWTLIPLSSLRDQANLRCLDPAGFNRA
jgi:hypothetical protein